MKKLFYFLLCTQLIYLISASIITSGNGLSVAGRLNREGISSTVIKTQHLNEEDQRRAVVNPDLTTSFADDTSSSNENRNDDTHFRLYYKSNSPGRSLSHELEHRYYKNPNNLLQTQRFQQPTYQDKLNAFFDSLEQVKNNYANNFNKNKQTTLNLHYHGNPELDLVKGYRNQEQNNHRKNVLKMLLMNIAQNNQRPQFKQYETNTNNENGLQYKIVHLKFKIEPQQGIVGQGVVETDNSAGTVVNLKHFNLLPREVPDLIRRLLYTAQQQHQPTYQSSFTIKKKRSESEMNLDDNTSNLEKRDDNSILKSKMKKPTTTTTEEDDKINDNEFQESLKSLQRRDDNFELDGASTLSDSDADLNTDRSARNDDEQSSLEEEV